MKLLDILFEQEKIKILGPRRSKEERQKNYTIAIQKKIQESEKGYNCEMQGENACLFDGLKPFKCEFHFCALSFQDAEANARLADYFDFLVKVRQRLEKENIFYKFKLTTTAILIKISKIHFRFFLFGIFFGSAKTFVPVFQYGAGDFRKMKIKKRQDIEFIPEYMSPVCFTMKPAGGETGINVYIIG